MSELHFRINRLEQYIMTMGYPLPSMGNSDDVVWVYAKAEIAKQQERVELLREALLGSKNKLVECALELNCMIDMKNADLESEVCSTSETPPDYFDAQTVHECMVQSKSCDDALAATAKG